MEDRMRPVTLKLSAVFTATLFLGACASTQTVNNGPKAVAVVRNTAVYDMSKRAPADRDG